MKMLYKKYNFFFLLKSALVFSLIFVLNSIKSFGQCPANIDFEDGTFNGWTCWSGTVRYLAGQNVISLNQSGNIFGKHEMLSLSPGDGLDPFGGFPKNCPNGSGHSIKLGNTMGGAEAEGVSYQFTIPANQNKFSLIYHYAVVFQDPGHPAAQQPKLEIQITNVTDNLVYSCSSFSFIATSGLPGFFQSLNQIGTTPVWCKNWSAASINLDGNAGKTIELFFKTADCTQGAHFGYAYIDVNAECSSSFIGATFCKDDTAVNITAPYGYQSYKWFDANFTKVLGTQQLLRLSPPPLNGSTVAVELIPYNGYGCTDTLYAQLLDTLTVVANAGADKTICTSNGSVQIGRPPQQGLVYKWTPSIGLSDTNISNPVASPTVSTKYVLTVNHDGGGCLSTDTVEVSVGNINNALQVIGNLSECGKSPILQVNQTDSIQWFKDGTAIPGATKTQYQVTQSGSYNAMLFTKGGCSKSTNVQQVDIFPQPVAGLTVNTLAQCFPGNQFTFTNSSSLSSGNLQYTWNLGDGTILNSRDVTHSYNKPGVYPVKLLVSAPGGCIDSTLLQVSVFATPTAEFSAKPVCVNLNVPLLNNTVNNTPSPINYLWDFGDGQSSTLQNPLHSYTTPGTYNIKLTVSSAQCASDLSTKQANVVVDAPLPGVQYPTKDAVINFPLKLQARSIGNSVLWSPATSLDNPRSYTPVFYGTTGQFYTIEIKTISGCITVDTQVVKTFKKIAIYVPNAFTPNGDGINDYLRPLLMGIKKVNYFKIYNRWGKLLYAMTSDQQPGWDGKLNGILQEMQVVVWVIEAEDIDGNIHQRRGSSFIMR